MLPPPPVPDCRTPAEVGQYLQLLRAWNGDSSFPDITLRVNAIRRARDTLQTARQTVDDCFQPGLKRLDHDLVLDIARALGLDEAGLIRLDEICRLADGRRPLAAPADVAVGIPMGRKEFTGRDQLLDQAMTVIGYRLACKRPPVVVFTGPAGIGKTELAVQLAHRVTDRYPAFNRLYFADLHGFADLHEPSRPEAVVATLLKLVGVRDPATPTLSNLDQQRRRLSQEFGTGGVLLVLDDVADIGQLCQLLPDVPDCVVIATSQERLDPAGFGTRFEVGRLDYDACTELLNHFDRSGRVDREAAVAVRLINDVCEARPFDLVMLAGLLADPEEVSWSLADHEARLKRLSRDEAERHILTGVCHRLPGDVRRVFRLLGLYPGFEFSAHEVAVLADLRLEDANVYLHRLYDRHLLLRRSAHHYYRLHDVVAAYTYHLLMVEESATNRKAALRRLHTATTRNPFAPAQQEETAPTWPRNPS